MSFIDVVGDTLTGLAVGFNQGYNGIGYTTFYSPPYPQVPYTFNPYVVQQMPYYPAQVDPYGQYPQDPYFAQVPDKSKNALGLLVLAVFGFVILQAVKE